MNNLMKPIRKILLFLAFSFQIFFVFAQMQENNVLNEQYRSVHWDTENGLSAGVTFCMLKDVKGFLWVGTAYGLNRFDGYKWKNYFADSTSNATVIGNG